MKLRDIEKYFISEYLKNGQNGTEAYLAIKTNVSRRSAAVCANRLLKKASVISEIEKTLDKKLEDSIASRSYLINEADEIGKEARDNGNYGSAIKAVEVKGKLNRVYDKEESDLRDYYKVLQLLNVNVSLPENERTVEIESDIIEE